VPAKENSKKKSRMSGGLDTDLGRGKQYVQVMKAPFHTLSEKRINE
jgi:hypothetical protein